MLDIEEVRKYANELSENIVNLTNFSHKLNELLLAVRELSSKDNQGIINEMKALRERVDSLEEQLVLKGMPGIERYEHDLRKIKEQIISDDWPEATPADSIPKTESDKHTRAETILDLVVTEFLNDTRFLEVGCGEGHVAMCAAKRGVKKSVGYDVEKKWKTDGAENLMLTTDWDRVKQSAPYDIILGYDVIDHICDMDVVTALHAMKNVLAQSGRIYLRAHPWCSRHGGHLYQKLNKAYAHLILDESELLRLFGISPEPVLKLTHPQETYKKWFRAAGLVVRDEMLTTRKVEEMFLSPSHAVKTRLDQNGVNHINMAIEYVDYILEVNESNQQVF